MEKQGKPETAKNPSKNANFFSTVTFLWTLRLFRLGFRRELEVSDLYVPLEEHTSSVLGDRISKLWKEEKDRCDKKEKGSHPSLLKVLLKLFGAEILMQGLFQAFLAVISIVQTMMLARLLSYYSKDSTMIKDEAYMWAGGVILCTFFTLLAHKAVYVGAIVGMKMRVACCSLVYRKILRLSTTALAETTVGQVVNLLSNDVERFDIAILTLNYIWIGPLQTVIVTYLIYLEMGWPAIVGMVSLLMCVPLQVYLGKKISALRMKTALRTDVRLRLMNEIINGIEVIKMYTWEKPFSCLVRKARKTELQVIKKSRIIQGTVKSFHMYVPRLALFATILTYVLLGNNITAEKVFTVTSFYTILRASMNLSFTHATIQLSQTLATVKRLQQFLSKRETEEQPCKLNKPASPSAAISMKNATAKWVLGAKMNNLSKVNLNIEPGKFVAVIGQVGSGKTSLLHAILRELPLQSGTLQINGRIAYASQEPWLFASSLRQNILFGRTMDEARYNKVIEVCQLRRDFAQFPYGDKTIVGERGIILSGGQRARVNLARAAYAEADVYLLDDPLSAVDSKVGKRIFEECIVDYMKGKTRILVTHQLHYLKNVDHVIVMNNGSVQAEGSFEELTSRRDFIELLEQPEEAEYEYSARDSSRRSSMQSLQLKVENQAEPDEVAEMKGIGKVSGRVYMSYFMATGSLCYLTMMLLIFILTQLAGSGGDYFISYWVNTEERSLRYVNDSVVMAWDNVLSRDECVYLYMAITVATAILAFIQCFVFYSMCVRASKNLHGDMFSNISRASMSFFHTNISGRILNRFSKDMGTIDEMLPMNLFDVTQIAFSLVGVVVILVVVNPWLIIPTTLIGSFLYLFQLFYVTTSSSLKRLEKMTHSPLLGHVSATLQGLTIIRVSSTETILTEEFGGHQDHQSSAWLTFTSVSQAFSLYVEFFCVIYMAIITFSFLVLDQETLGGNVGLAITQCMGLGMMLQYGMLKFVQMENHMTSVERVVEYRHVEQELQLGSKPPNGWPTSGHLEFKNMYLRYNLEEPPVLHGLNFVIMPKEKIGIVGRSGAGKSSLISALFRLAPIDGDILIDGVSTSLLGLHDLRSKISIIPQEPFLFSGSLRKNLDPFDEYANYKLWQALKEVELTRVVNELGAGLDFEISEGGSNFSVGQRQLLCLARAILRNNRILVLDEATANVDPETDDLIQSTIRRTFADSTIITVAHRLNTVMDSDKILVMDAGAMVEFDHPHTLLQNKQGFLYRMVEHCGDAMGKVLRNTAAENYFTRKSS